MTKVTWDEFTDLIFEAGVSQGVLFVEGLPGVPWVGLTSIKDTPKGGEPRPFYMDGRKYLNIPAAQEYEGSITAFTYPDEFEVCDGTASVYDGFTVTHQPQKPFSFTYRTGVGNTYDALDFGYKLHIVYNALASPTSKNYDTVSEDTEPLTFSWNFTTTPFSASGFAPVAHIVLDSTKVNKVVMRVIEEKLYGTSHSEPSLITFDEISAIFADPPLLLAIQPDYESGISQLFYNEDVGDLLGDIEDGIYTMSDECRLREIDQTGIYILET